MDYHLEGDNPVVASVVTALCSQLLLRQLGLAASFWGELAGSSFGQALGGNFGFNSQLRSAKPSDASLIGCLFMWLLQESFHVGERTESRAASFVLYSVVCVVFNVGTHMPRVPPRMQRSEAHVHTAPCDGGLLHRALLPINFELSLCSE